MTSNISKLQELPRLLGILGWEKISPIFCACWVADVPCVLIGDPGSAKSTFQLRFAKALGLKVEILDLQFLNTTRLLGIPNPEKLKEGFLEYVGGIIAKRPDVVICEELTRCFDHVQGYMLEFLREGRLDQQYLKCKRIANCNPPTNMLVGVHHLDYAKATRITHVPVPNISLALADTFLDSWTTQWVLDPKAVEIGESFKQVQLEQPPAAKLRQIAEPLIKALFEYNFSGRQIEILLRLLSASYSLEKSGLHSFTAADIGFLAASIIPLQLTKHKWPIKPEMLATNLTKHLPDFPWQQSNSPEIQVSSVKVEMARQKFSLLSEADLLGYCADNTLEADVAFEILLEKIKDNPTFEVYFSDINQLASIV